MSFGGFKSVTISDGTTTVSLNNIVPGASSFKFTAEIKKDFDGKQRKIREQAQLIIATFDFDDVGIFDNWMKNKTAITSITVTKFNGTIAWSESTTLLLRRRHSAHFGGRAYLILEFQKKGSSLNIMVT